MQPNRINVGGIWYVREQEVDLSGELSEFSTIFYEDNSIYIRCEYTPLKIEDNVVVIYLNKEKHGMDSRYEEIWDNVAWIRGVAGDDLVDLDEYPEHHRPIIHAFCKELKERGII